jgi:hypothetical protein
MASSVSIPIRSGVYGSREPARSATVRPAAARNAASNARLTAATPQPEVGQRLHDVAVRVADLQRVAAIALARDRVAARPDADPGLASKTLIASRQ